MTENLFTDLQKLFKYLNTTKKKYNKKSTRLTKTKSWLTEQLYK